MKSDWGAVAMVTVTGLFLMMFVTSLMMNCDDGQVWVHTDVVRGCVPVTEAVNLK